MAITGSRKCGSNREARPSSGRQVEGVEIGIGPGHLGKGGLHCDGFGQAGMGFRNITRLGGVTGEIELDGRLVRMPGDGRNEDLPRLVDGFPSADRIGQGDPPTGLFRLQTGQLTRDPRGRRPATGILMKQQGRSKKWRFRPDFIRKGLEDTARLTIHPQFEVAADL